MRDITQTDRQMDKWTNKSYDPHVRMFIQTVKATKGHNYETEVSS